MCALSKYNETSNIMRHPFLSENLHSKSINIPCTTKSTFQASFSILPLYYSFQVGRRVFFGYHLENKGLPFRMYTQKTRLRHRVISVKYTFKLVSNWWRAKLYDLSEKAVVPQYHSLTCIISVKTRYFPLPMQENIGEK